MQRITDPVHFIEGRDDGGKCREYMDGDGHRERR